MSTVADQLVAELAKAGIDRIFGLPGGEIVGLMNAVQRRQIEFVLTRHEADAGMAAAVYGKLKRRPGVVFTTLGPGAANLMLPLSSSLLDREPLLAISAQIPESFPHTHTHQLLPLIEAYRPVTKYAAKVDAHNVGRVVPEACRAALGEPMGPAFLTLAPDEASRPIIRGSATQSTYEVLPMQGDPEAAARSMLEALAGAERPLVLLGLGVDQRLAQQLRAWLDSWNLPVAVTPKVKGVVDETRANFVGVIGGMAADDIMCDMVEQADLLLGFGLDPVELDKTWHAELPILWVLQDPNACGMIPPDRVLWADHECLLEVLNSVSAPRAWDTPFAESQAHRLARLDGHPTDAGVMWPGTLVRSLSAALPPETIVTTDVGSHKYLFGQYWPNTKPETFFMSNGLSGMGYGLSAALGAKLARPEVPVLAAVGDGGFSMNFQELETMERVGAPVIIIVLTDNSYSLIKLAQEKRGLSPYGVDFGPIDSVKVAEACGVEGLRTKDPEVIAAAAAKAARENRSLVIEVPVDYTDYKRIF